MQQITESTLRFLRDLKSNNHRDWFEANKPRYEVARKEFMEFVDALIIEIGKFDPSVSHFKAKDCVFRIYRDVRFSKDKSPYKTHFGAHISSAAKRAEIHSRAGYYLHLGPGDSMLAGGAYLPQAAWLKAIRQEINYNTEAFKKILDHKDFKRYFGELTGEKLKTAPREYPKDHPEIELLKHKSFLAVHQNTDKQVLDENFLQHCTNVFKALFPFDQFLNQSMD